MTPGNWVSWVYGIPCCCGKFYIGRTHLQFVEKFIEHRDSIEKSPKLSKKKKKKEFIIIQYNTVQKIPKIQATTTKKKEENNRTYLRPGSQSAEKTTIQHEQNSGDINSSKGKKIILFDSLLNDP